MTLSQNMCFLRSMRNYLWKNIFTIILILLTICRGDDASHGLLIRRCDCIHQKFELQFVQTYYNIYNAVLCSFSYKYSSKYDFYFLIFKTYQFLKNQFSEYNSHKTKKKMFFYDAEM